MPALSLAPDLLSRPAGPDPDGVPASPSALARHAVTLAGRPDLWQPLLRFTPERRGYTRLAEGPGWEAWVLTWLPGHATGLHDHGPSLGAFTVLQGEVEEVTLLTPTDAPGPARLARRRYPAGSIRSFGADHVHEVAHAGTAPAVSLHVYGPALERMTRYRVDAAGVLLTVEVQQAGRDW